MSKRRSVGQSSVNVKLWNEHQERAWEAIESSDVTFLVGPAGTAKTHIATAYALKSLIDENHSKVYISRPVVEAAGEQLGFLPGRAEEKIHPYLVPIYECMDIIFGVDDSDNRDLIIKQKEALLKKVHVFPIAHARGRSMHQAVCILDEAQNTTRSQLKLWMTRLGLGSKLIITGDPQQSDIKHSCLAGIIPHMRSKARITVVEFPNEAIVRNPLVTEILDAFARYEEINPIYS